MDFLLKITYYGASEISALLFVFFFGVGLLNSTHNKTRRKKAVFLGSGSVGMVLLLWSFRDGHLQEQWLKGTLLSVGGLALSGVLTFYCLWIFTSGSGK